MNESPPIPSVRRQLGLFLLFIGGGFLVASICATIILLNAGVSAAGGARTLQELSTDTLKVIQSVFTVSMFLLPALLFARFVYPKKPLQHLGFHPASKNVFYFLAVLAMLVSFPLDGWLEQVNKAMPMSTWMVERQKDADQQIMAFLKTSSTTGALINLLIIALLPAICEEACFRGALQPILIRSFRNPWAGILLTAFIFSACHLQFQGFLPRMALGVLLGAIYWYSGSLWVSIVAHFVTNAVQVIAATWYPKYVAQDPYVPMGFAMGSLILVVLLLLLIRKLSVAKYPPGPAEFQ